MKAEAVALSRGVLIHWRTGYEVRNLGFKLYREDASGNRVVISPAVVAGSALFAGAGTEMRSGRSYTFWDNTAKNYASDRYWIQAIDLNGSGEWYGPFLSHPVSAEEESRIVDQLGLQHRSSPTLSALGARQRLAMPLGTPRVAVRAKTGPVELQWKRAGEAGAKIFIKEEGWYRVTRADLVGAGFDPGPDPTGLHLFAEGIEQAIRVTGTSDGYFDMGDAIEFYGVGMDTPSTGTRVYWLTKDGRPGMRIRVAPPVMGERPTRLQTWYPATIERRDRAIYVPAVINNGDRDNFYVGVVSQDPLETSLRVDNVFEKGASGEAIPILRVSLQGFTDGEHSVVVELNGQAVGEMTFEGQAQAASSFPVGGLLQEGNNRVELSSRNGDADVSLLDSVAIMYSRRFAVRDDVLSMTAMRDATIELTGFHGKVPQVMDVSDPARPMEIRGEVLDDKATGSGYRFTVPGAWVGTGQEAALYAFAEDRIKRPAKIVANVPSSWNVKNNRADLVIITHPDFLEAAELLAAHRRDQGLGVAVVSIDDVYDEFGFGEKDPAAIRAFLHRAEDVWAVPPHYVLLLGDASFDPRDFLGKGSFDFVPTHIQPTILLKTASDDWFGEVGENGRTELAIGRIPARTPQSARTVVDKIIGYDSTDASGWADHVMLVADKDTGTFSFEEATDDLIPLIPGDLIAEKIFIGETGEDVARQAILDAFNSGQLLINYEGHGSQAIWTSHGVLGVEDVENMTNGDRLPAVVAMNCLNGLFQDVYQQSMAEALLLHPGGGAVAVWASSALTDPAGQAKLNEALYSSLFGQEDAAIGDAIVLAKDSITDPYVRASWIFFGDPSMRLKH